MDAYDEERTAAKNEGSSEGEGEIKEKGDPKELAADSRMVLLRVIAATYRDSGHGGRAARHQLGHKLGWARRNVEFPSEFCRTGS
jgi:hypothetical protein